jgi:Tol biopolymer transport system component
MAFRRTTTVLAPSAALALALAVGISGAPGASATSAEKPTADQVWGKRTTLESVTSSERAANGPSYDNPAVSGDGRYVAFTTDATNLAGKDTNHEADVYLRDRRTGKTSRVSVSGSEKQGNGQSVWPSISADGRYVVFTSSASNLVPGDTNGQPDVFVRDRTRGTTTRISVSSSEKQGRGGSYDGVLSADGRSVVFVSDAANLVSRDTNRQPDVFKRDLRKGTTTRVSVGVRGQANDRSMGRAISADGRFVAFVSLASNLVKGDTNREWDVFLRDTRKGTTVRVSVGPKGRQGDVGDPMGTGFPQSISDDGRYVLFDSDATTLVDGDTNGRYDVFLHDVRTRTTRRLSVRPDGSQNPQDSFARGMTGDARTVLFSTYEPLTPGDTNGAFDAFVLDRTTGRMRLASVAVTGRAGNDDTGPAAISRDGRHVAFLSHSSDLVRGDKNPESDIFLRHLR